MANIHLRDGDLLLCDAQALVNPVNCAGSMGKGLALQFARAFPANLRVYKVACENKTLRPGGLLVVPLDEAGAVSRAIINFATKDDWRNGSRMEWIEAGPRALVREVRQREIRSIAIPALGCGLGGLDWMLVRPRIEAAFAEVERVEVLLYSPRWNSGSHPVPAKSASHSVSIKPPRLLAPSPLPPTHTAKSPRFPRDPPVSRPRKKPLGRWPAAPPR